MFGYPVLSPWVTGWHDQDVTGPMGTTYEEEAPRLSEIVRMLHNMDRKFDDFRIQVQNQLNDKVSKERYEPERERLNDKIMALEKDITLTKADTEKVRMEAQAQFTAMENQAKSKMNTVYGALGSLVVGAILLWLGAR